MTTIRSDRCVHTNREPLRMSRIGKLSRKPSNPTISGSRNRHRVTISNFKCVELRGDPFPANSVSKPSGKSG